MKWIAQYSGWLRQVRLFHWLHNLARRKTLLANRQLYDRLGIRRSVLRSIDSRKLRRYADLGDPSLTRILPGIQGRPPDLPPDVDWDAAARQWSEEGFIRLVGYFPAQVVDRINADIESGLAGGSLHFNYTGRKIFNAQRRLPSVRQVTSDPGIIAILTRLFQSRPVHFQTISFMSGSEQRAHSDAIHMTTLPLGYLAGVWVALEDIHPGNGPLTYYPGSHRLPYILNGDYGNSSNWFMLDGRANVKYEKKIREVIRESGLSEVQLKASKGDVFIWHANLLHGGAPILEAGSTRKSMVSHYFAEGVLCFHEISERPAIITGAK